MTDQVGVWNTDVSAIRLSAMAGTDLLELGPHRRKVGARWLVNSAWRLLNEQLSCCGALRRPPLEGRPPCAGTYRRWIGCTDDQLPARPTRGCKMNRPRSMLLTATTPFCLKYG
jgi:hypothetical protein